MAKKERLAPNEVNAPILFIGMGGRGSDIIRMVADKCVNDKIDNIRFLTFDTDVNDLSRVSKGAIFSSVQTSSTSTVEDYLENDKYAAEYWFPVNNMLKSKTVSEGAGAVRAISRLALNATIKEGRILPLYKAIDDLFLKRGKSNKQAVKIIIASTAAGGTGSGIAMIVGMLIRRYIKRNYSESAAIVRGFLVMPNVMDTVIKAQSERESQRRNGYATVKEVNAFMMKGSGAFDTMPELKRYKDLHILVPTVSSGYEKLDNLPFDFCFLMERSDANDGTMDDLKQYMEFAAQTIYEQCIGPMQTKSTSQEDNVLKELIDKTKLGRSRFAGAGASILRYPYEDIRDYMALSWTRAAIIGSSNDENLTEEERKALLANSWLQYDNKFEEEYSQWSEDVNANPDEEPERSSVYMREMESGSDSSSGNTFTAELWSKYLKRTLENMPIRNGDDPRNADTYAMNFIDNILNELFNNHAANKFAKFSTDYEKSGKKALEKNCTGRFNSIEKISKISQGDELVDLAKGFAKTIFSSKAPILKKGLGDFMLESYLSYNGSPVHPNVARYLLYKLVDALELKKNNYSMNVDATQYAKDIKDIKEGKEVDGKNEISQFKIALNLKEESTLKEMAEECDKHPSDTNLANCNTQLNKFYNKANAHLYAVAFEEIYKVGLHAIKNLIRAYEEFYQSFNSKVPGIERAKEDIVTKLEFNAGDYVHNLFASEEYLEKLYGTLKTKMRATDGDATAKLFAKIFDTVRNNAYIEERKGVDPFSHESQEDVFDNVIVEYYKDAVEKSCDNVIDRGILQAIKLEYEISNMLESDKVDDEEAKKNILAMSKKDEFVKKYILQKMEICQNLAAPGVRKRDFGEPREVNAVAYSAALSDGNGIRVDTYLSNAVKSESVSRYELRFFRSIYDIMPTQLTRFCAPKPSKTLGVFDLDPDYDCNFQNAGDYFRMYQTYMDEIGMDCSVNSTITPHIDTRWNSISVMPEIDLDFQKRLMKKIHKAMLYGFIYKRIEIKDSCGAASGKKVYIYLDNQNNDMELKVSNKTKCDRIYEVLDAMYFDRLAVSTIHKYVRALREKNRMNGAKTFEDTSFYKGIQKLKRSNIAAGLEDAEGNISVFELLLIYYNSLPVQLKDDAELRTMTEALIEAIACQMIACTPDSDRALYAACKFIAEQYELLETTYHAMIEAGKADKSETVAALRLIKNTIKLLFDDCDVTFEDFQKQA